MAKKKTHALPLPDVGTRILIRDIEKETRCQVTLRTHTGQRKKLSAQAQPPLFRIPPELRNTIYDLLFEAKEYNILLTCRQAWLEAHLMAIDSHIFTFRFLKSSGYWSWARRKSPLREGQRLCAFFQCLTLRNRVELNKVKLIFSHENLLKLESVGRVKELFGGNIYAKQLEIVVDHNFWEDLEPGELETLDFDWVWNMLNCSYFRMLEVFQIKLQAKGENDQDLYATAQYIAQAESERFELSTTTDFDFGPHSAHQDKVKGTGNLRDEWVIVTLAWHNVDSMARSKMARHLQPVSMPAHRQLYIKDTNRGGPRAKTYAENKNSDKLYSRSKLSQSELVNPRDAKQDKSWRAVNATAEWLDEWEEAGALLTLVNVKDTHVEHAHPETRREWRRQAKVAKKLAKRHARLRRDAQRAFYGE